MKVHLVDGTFELFRCHHGAPRAQVDGREVGAVRGLVATLASLLRGDDVTHVAVAFDAMAPPRGALGGGDAEVIRSQALLAFEAVRALGVPLWPMTRYQADDALASGAARLRDGADVLICTSDKDLLQCVRGERVVVWNRIRKEVTDEAAVRAKFGVAPTQIPDLFALVGDPSDGLPGVPGWGWTSAAKVLAEYGAIEEIPESADEWGVKVRGAKRLAATLQERRVEALLGRDLSRLREDLPVPATLEQLEWRGVKQPALDELLAQLGDANLAEWVPDRLGGV